MRANAVRCAAVLGLTLAVASASRGDPLPDGAVARLGSVRFLHGDWVHTLAFFPDDKALLAGTHESFLRVWDAATGREDRRLPGDGSSLMCVALSPDRKRLAVGDNSLRLLVLDAATGKVLVRTRGDTSSVTAVAWAPDGKTVAAGGLGHVVRLFDAATGQELRRMEGHKEHIMRLAFTPDGKELVSASGDKTLRVWDAATGKELRQLDGRVEFTGCLVLSPDGKTAACDCAVPSGPNSYWSVVRLWDVRTGKALRDLKAHSTYAMAFSPDGKLLATGDASRYEIRLWDPATGDEVRRWKAHEERVTALAFTSDGKTLASGGADRRVCLWDPATGTERLPADGHRGAVQSVAFAPDGKTVVSGGKDRTMRLWDPATGKELRRCDDVGGPYWGLTALGFSPDGKTLASLEPTGSSTTFRLWDPATGKERLRFDDPKLPHWTFAFLPDNETLASAGVDYSISVWELTTGKLVRKLGKHKGHVVALAVSPDGKTIAWAGEYQGVGLWDAVTGKGVHTFAGTQHHGDSALAFSPDGRLLATASSSDPLRLWDPVTGRKVAEWPSGRASPCLAFSPDGLLLALPVTHGVALWDVAAGREVRRFTGHLAEVRSMAWAPDGRAVVTASADGTLLVWDATGLMKDGRVKEVKLTAKGLEDHWAALANAGPAKAHEAGWALASCADAAAFLGKHLRAVEAVDEPMLKRWIEQLDHDEFTVRQQAMAHLARAGEMAAPALRRAVASGPSPEVRVRAERVLREVDSPAPTAERLRGLRAVAVLERIGTPEARRVLEGLAKGADQASLTRDAKAALARLDRRAGER
jgi:WD40 repeat protein